MDDTYTTIKTESQIELKVKGSRFIGETFRVPTVDEALTQLEAVRKREYRATHHCSAYVVGLVEPGEFKYSDDGEPSGTAGRPIYDVIAGSGLTNLLVVVTRYYGGTKLGTGGLSRAYSDAARAAIEASGNQTHFLTRTYHFVLDFAQYDQWLRELHRHEATVVDSAFCEQVKLFVKVRLSQAEGLVAAFVELTSGKGEVEEIKETE